MKKKETAKDETLLVKEMADKLLSLMGVEAGASVSFDKENDAIKVDIVSENETGLLIGRRGETLNSIQTVLGMMYRQETGEWKRIIVNIGDWREKQEDYLKSLATDAAERAKTTGEPQALYNLTPSQRRIIHLGLSEDTEVTTESVGEEPERYLVVKPKK